MNSTYENLRECLEKLDRVSNFDNKLKIFSEILIEATNSDALMSEAKNINNILKQCKNDKLRENNLKFVKWIREAKDSNKFKPDFSGDIPRKKKLDSHIFGFLLKIKCLMLCI